MRRHRKSVVGYCLATGERREWDSITDCASYIGAVPQAVSAAIKRDRAVKGWCVAEFRHESRAASLYESGGKRNDESTEGKTRLVPMRLDSHTTIYVRPSEANEGFLERYRKRLGKVNFDE